MDFGLELKRLREGRNLSQKELAERADLPLPTLRKIEQGSTRDVTLAVAFRLSEVLGVPLDRLGLIADMARRCREAQRTAPQDQQKH